jgi:hypothetical protein
MVKQFLKKYEDLDMVKEIQTATFTSFSNLDECDNDETLSGELLIKQNKTKKRKR